MEIEVNTHGATKAILVPAQMEGEAVPAVESRIRRLIDDGTKMILCNFSQTEFVSDDGLSMFVAVLKDFHRLQGQMAFCI